MKSRCPDGWSWIRNFHICCTRVQTMLTNVRTVVFKLRFLPYEWARPDGNPCHPDGCINLPLFELGKKIWSWSITGRRSDRLLRRLDGCKLEQKLLDTVEGPDGMARRPDGWNTGQMSVRTGWHVVRTAGKDRTFMTCRIFSNTSE